MNSYQISSPRKAFAIASFALTAITIAVAVVVPAKMQSDARDVRTVAALTVTAPAARARLQVQVVGTRAAELTAVQAQTVLQKRRQDG